MNELEVETPIADLGLSYYLFMGFAGLVVLCLALLERLDICAVLPAGNGALGLATFLVPARFGILQKPLYFAPIFVLLTLTVFLGLSYSYSRSSVQLLDLMAAPALLAYLAAQYRLFALRGAAVPVDPRPRLDRPDGDLPESRPPEQVSPREPIRLIIVVAVCMILGQVAWQWVMSDWLVLSSDLEPHLGIMRETTWRMISLIWLLGSALVILVGLFRLLRIYRMSRDESAMVAVDTLWAETRGEQRRIARWTAWRRRKLERQLENQS
jgi:hypothetical protein